MPVERVLKYDFSKIGFNHSIGKTAMRVTYRMYATQENTDANTNAIFKQSKNANSQLPTVPERAQT